MQSLIVSLIVAAAAGYAAWQLMPHSMRRWLTGRLMAVAPWHRVWLARLQADAENAGCSTCRGCSIDRQPPASPGQAKAEVPQRGAN